MSQLMTKTRKETERTRLIQEKCQTLLTQMLRDEDNKYCVDCDAKGPRWASWNIGVFLCIRCAGIHRNLGVHISRVKSVNLDTWTPEQVISLQQMGNSRARAVYEAQLPDGFRRPQTDTALESFIRAKYEQKKYIALEWVPLTLPKVDWAREIDDELEKQKKKKKANQSSGITTFGSINSFTSNIAVDTDAKKSPSSKMDNAAIISQPRSLSAQSQTPDVNDSPKIVSPHDINGSINLLGLSSPTKTSTAPCANNLDLAVGDVDQHTDLDGFLCTSPIGNQERGRKVDSNTQYSYSASLLVKEEEDFFSQCSLAKAPGADKESPKKLTKDGILALYGTRTASSGAITPNALTNFSHQAMPILYGSASSNSSYMMPCAAMVHTAQQQFRTPPNSSMFNAPVMTAPTAFTSSGMGGNVPGMAGKGCVFGAQFVMQNFNEQRLSTTLSNKVSGQSVVIQSNHQPTSNLMTHSPHIRSTGLAAAVPVSVIATSTGSNISVAAPSASVLNQQFENLNIANAWQ